MPRIALLDFYVEKLGAELGLFGDWEVPMRFTNAIEEHLAVRTSVAFFDVSHMGRVLLRGPDVVPFIQYIYTKDLSKTKQSFMSGPTLALTGLARVRDDEMLYRVSDEEWLVVPNALAREKMLKYFNWIINEKNYKVEVVDMTDKYSMIAIQGPDSPGTLESLGARWTGDLKPLEFRLNEEIGNSKVFLVSRSGWTGEDGFEVWGEHGEIKKLVDALLARGVKPAGLIARDTLRVEMGFVLGEHEYGEDPLKYPCAISLRYGMGAISWEKRGFVGEEALRACRREGVRWIRIGLRMGKEAGRLFPRPGHGVYVDDVWIGWITSGCYSPVLNRGIAMAYVDTRYSVFGEEVSVEIHGRRYPAKIVDFPFIDKR
ncbi:MAG: glycine cleavage system aminomethyltransferase GcvT [Desulfurococcaceae archaeon]